MPACESVERESKKSLLKILHDCKHRGFIFLRLTDDLSEQGEPIVAEPLKAMRQAQAKVDYHRQREKFVRLCREDGG